MIWRGLLLLSHSVTSRHFVWPRRSSSPRYSAPPRHSGLDPESIDVLK